MPKIIPSLCVYPSTERAFAALLEMLKPDIEDDYRASDDPDDDTPGMCVTFGMDQTGQDWSYQTGDNSYTGGAYGHAHWGVVYLYRDSDCKELAREAAGEIAEQRYMCA